MFYECLKLGIKNRNSVRKISHFYLQQGQGKRGRAGPHLPTQGYIEYPPPRAEELIDYGC